MQESLCFRSNHEACTPSDPLTPSLHGQCHHWYQPRSRAMTPAARVEAAIGLLDKIIDSAPALGPPADRILADWFRANRFAGSKDRRAVRELVFRAIRACGPVPPSGRAAMLRLVAEDPDLRPLFDGSAYGPAPIAEDEPVAEGGVAPGWLAGRLAASGIDGAEARTLLDRAPLDSRVNVLKAGRAALSLPLAGEPLPSAQRLRLPHGTQVDSWAEYAEGLVEVQDCGRQLACEAVGAPRGEAVVVRGAGAGGKILALAAAMRYQCPLVAADTDRGRLSRPAPRVERAAALAPVTVLRDPGKELESLAVWRDRADAVPVDAP